MGIAAILVFAFGLYLFIKRRSGEKIPDEAQEFGSRLGRSVHAAVPLPGLMGQAPASMMPEPQPDEIGPEDSHIATVSPPDAADEHGGSFVDVDAVRAKLDAIMADDEPGRRPRRAAKK